MRKNTKPRLSLTLHFSPTSSPQQRIQCKKFAANIQCFWYSTPLCESCPVEIKPLVPLGLDISDPARKAHKDVYGLYWNIGKKANKICRMLERAKSFTRISALPNVLIAQERLPQFDYILNRACAHVKFGEDWAKALLKVICPLQRQYSEQAWCRW